MKELEQQLQQALQQAAAEQQRADECSSRLQQLQETLQIKDACLKDATAALNEAKSENRRLAALLHVSQQLLHPPSTCNCVTMICRKATSSGGRTTSMRTGSWAKRLLRLRG
jgi:hypothetical protein